jgi:hypothetical protein
MTLLSAASTLALSQPPGILPGGAHQQESTTRLGRQHMAAQNGDGSVGTGTIGSAVPEGHSRSSRPWSQLQAVSSRLVQQCTTGLPLATCGVSTRIMFHVEDSSSLHPQHQQEAGSIGVPSDAPDPQILEHTLRGEGGSLGALHAALRLVCIQVVHSPDDTLRTSAFR